MIRDGHVSRQEVILLLWITLASKIFLVAARDLLGMGFNSAWWLFLVGAGGACCLFWFMFKLIERFPGIPLTKIPENIIGKWPGKGLGLVFASFFFILTILRLREFSETIASVVLPQTPISVIILTYTILMIFATQSGLETIVRSARLLVPFIVVPSLLIFVAAEPHAQVVRLLPFIDVPLGDLTKTAYMSLTMFGSVVMIGVIAPYVRKPKEIWLGGIVGILLSALVISLVTASTVAIFSLRGALRIQFPTYSIATLISFGEFMQRIESVFVFMWFFSAILTLSVLFYTTCLSIAQVLDLTEYKPLTWPIGVIAFGLSFLPNNIIQSFNLDFGSFGRFVSAIVFFLPVPLYLISLALRKKVESGDGSEQG